MTRRKELPQERSQGDSRDRNRDHRVAETEERHEAQISRWLKLAKRMLDGDDDPTPSAA